ncbi:argininosuccinate lyase [Lutimaribacter saemankumensis]|uniref:Argininosuccinate lyase n=1 Tax=Lutimaribacter saemankumensis TaxID=490829 RepID=A0A1G8KZ43_9RHOB|nr:argininosuccinate lyase [Lutimaribacter saemankumensis]SDI48659.1 hypothetical protein SAMN05421850_103103 [Lutimaribacter saemankumensis]
MKPVAALLTLALLAACGADGEPIRPSLAIDAGTSTGISVTGDVTIGVSG